MNNMNKRYTPLSDYEYTELWSQIELVNKRLSDAITAQNTVDFYKHMNTLDVLRAKLQNHHVGKELEKVEKFTQA